MHTGYLVWSSREPVRVWLRAQQEQKSVVVYELKSLRLCLSGWSGRA